MRELLIVVADFYWADSQRDSNKRSMTRERSGLTGLSDAVRFGSVSTLENGWRAALASWLGQEDMAAAAPAIVASASIAAGTGRAFAWIAQPVHLITSLSSVHLDHAGLLRLDASTQSQLVESFKTDFAGTPYALAALPAGSFLLSGPEAPSPQGMDPARYLGSSIESAIQRGDAAAAMRRVAGELEMWLHEHPVNLARARARQRSVSTLWLWGGGSLPSALESSVVKGSMKQALFGEDAYLAGLAALGAGSYEASTLTELRDFSHVMQSEAERAAVVVEAYRLPDNSPVSTPMQALEELDRRWMVPATEALACGRLQSLQIIATDRLISLAPRDRLKFWRRKRSALAALQ